MRSAKELITLYRSSTKEKPTYSQRSCHYTSINYRTFNVEFHKAAWSKHDITFATTQTSGKTAITSQAPARTLSLSYICIWGQPAPFRRGFESRPPPPFFRASVRGLPRFFPRVAPVPARESRSTGFLRLVFSPPRRRWLKRVVLCGSVMFLLLLPCRCFAFRAAAT